MRHRVQGKKLNRDSSHRKALRLNLTVSLLQNERIETTLAKNPRTTRFPSEWPTA